MLSDKRIREAQTNVKNYFDEGLLKKTGPNKHNVDTHIRNSKESLKVANFIFEEDLSVLWVVVISYYSMYYIANAVLLKFGYKLEIKYLTK